MDDSSKNNRQIPPPKDDSLYDVRNGDESVDPARLSETQRRWQMPKEGMVEPPEQENALYATSAQTGAGEISDDVRRWQMPKEGLIDDKPIHPDELYAVGSSAPPGVSSEEIRSWQTPASETVAPPSEGELYSVSDKCGTPDQRGPDLRVLFADSKVAADDVYGVGPTQSGAPQDTGAESNAPPSVPPSTDAASPTPSAPPAPPVSESQSESASDDVYGVSAPTPAFYASNVKNPSRSYEDPDEKYKGIAGKKDLEGDMSIDMIYGRRMERERTGMFDAPKPVPAAIEEPEVEKSSLPKHPFVKGIFRPFFSPGFLLRLFMLTFAATVPFYLGIWFFSRVADDLAEFERTLPVEQIDAQNESNVVIRTLSAPKVEKFLACLYEDRLVLFFVCLVWGVFAVPYFLQVFTATAAGDDRIAEWPELSMLGGVVQFLWLAGLVFAAGIPGWILFGLLGWPELGFAAGTILLTPIFFLSCMETDSLFTLITPNVLRSFSTVGRSWRRFYLVSAVLYLIGIFGFCSILWNVVWLEQERKPSVVIAAVLASILFSILPVVYLRYLGRLAWIIQEDAATKSKKKPKKKKPQARPKEDVDEDDDEDDVSPRAAGQFTPPPNPREALRHLAAIPEPPEEKPRGTGRFRLKKEESEEDE